jgi:hypothetical protein
MKIRVFLIAVCVLLAGCSFEMPGFDAGKLETHVLVDGRDRATMSALSQGQLNAIEAWFSAHQAGWKKSYVDAAPAKFVYLSKAGAPVAYFNLSGSTLYAASYSRILTSSEVLALEAILTKKEAANQSLQPTALLGRG